MYLEGPSLVVPTVIVKDLGAKHYFSGFLPGPLQGEVYISLQVSLCSQDSTQNGPLGLVKTLCLFIV